MGIVIPPPQFEPLVQAISIRFGFDELDIALYKSSLERMIHRVASEQWTRFAIAKACVDAAVEHNATDDFLYFLAQRRRDDREFRELLAGLDAGFADRLSAATPEIGTVVSGLNEAREQLAEPAVRAAAAGSRALFADLSLKVRRLKVFKGLHDCLHQVQLRRFSSIREAAFQMKVNADSKEQLRNFQGNVEKAHADASEFLTDLAADDPARKEVEDWIEKLGEAVERLRAAANDDNVGEALWVLEEVEKILEWQPSELNKLIFSIAESLPFAKLAEALDKVTAVAGGGVQSVGDAAKTLHAINANLKGHIREHNLWQEADDKLWALERHASKPADRSFVFVVKLWPKTETLIDALANNDAEAKWSKRVREYGSKVRAELDVVERALPDDGKVAPIDIDLGTRLYQAYGDYRQEARGRFYLVDKALKRECSTLVEIDAPLRSILQELDRHV